MKKSGDEDIRPAVAGDIVGFDPHAAHRVALPVDGRSAPDPARFQFAVAQIAVMKIGHFVIADEYVRLAVAVEIVLIVRTGSSLELLWLGEPLQEGIRLNRIAAAKPAARRRIADA